MSAKSIFVLPALIAVGVVTVFVSVAVCATELKDPVCPGHKFKCADNQTCCQLQYGRFGCCPYPDAVCCSDKQSCCPNGFQCNITARTCTRNRTIANPMILVQRPQENKLTSNEIIPDNGNITLSSSLGVGKQTCPDQHQSCPDTYTCCSQASGGYGCCPLTGAICCPDKVHCCPMGTFCNSKLGSCDS